MRQIFYPYLISDSNLVTLIYQLRYFSDVLRCVRWNAQFSFPSRRDARVPRFFGKIHTFSGDFPGIFEVGPYSLRENILYSRASTLEKGRLKIDVGCAIYGGENDAPWQTTILEAARRCYFSRCFLADKYPTNFGPSRLTREFSEKTGYRMFAFCVTWRRYLITREEKPSSSWRTHLGDI